MKIPFRSTRLALLAGASLIAGAAVAASANATATIVTPITITKSFDLVFGQVVASAAGGTVVMDTNGTATGTGVTVGTSLHNAASFAVHGSPSATYAITLPSSAVTISDTATPANTMSVDSFTSNPTGTGTLDGSGNQTLDVGATLTVGANQTAGTYSGSFDVTVAYN